MPRSCRSHSQPLQQYLRRDTTEVETNVNFLPSPALSLLISLLLFCLHYPTLFSFVCFCVTMLCGVICRMSYFCVKAIYETLNPKIDYEVIAIKIPACLYICHQFPPHTHNAIIHPFFVCNNSTTRSKQVRIQINACSLHMYM